MSNYSAATVPKEGRKKAFSFLFGLATIMLMVFASNSQAQVAPSLGTADSFAVGASSTVTNSGPSVVNGDLGVDPGNACTGFQAPCTGGGPGTVNGTIHLADPVSLGARSDATTAYTDLAGQACAPGNNFTGQDLGGMTLTSGVYCFTSTAGLTGDLTLNGDVDDVFIFQVGSGLTTAPSSSVNLTGGAQSCNVFWQVGSTATLNTSNAFVGNILANASINLNTGTTVDGRLLAGVGAGGAGQVSLLSNTVTRSSCATGTGGGGDGGGGSGGDGGGGDGSGGDGSGDGGGDDGGPGGGGPDVTPPDVDIDTPPGVSPPGGGGPCIAEDFKLRLKARDESGVRSMKVYLNDNLVKKTGRREITVWIRAEDLSAGRHSIRVVVRDEEGNENEKIRNFRRCNPPVFPLFTG